MEGPSQPAEAGMQEHLYPKHKKKVETKAKDKKKKSLKKCIRIICLERDAESTRAISSEKRAREISSRKLCSKAGTDLGDSEGLPSSGVEERGKISSSSQEEKQHLDQIAA